MSVAPGRAEAEVRDAASLSALQGIVKDPGEVASPQCFLIYIMRGGGGGASRVLQYGGGPVPVPISSTYLPETSPRPPARLQTLPGLGSRMCLTYGALPLTPCFRGRRV